MDCDCILMAADASLQRHYRSHSIALPMLTYTYGTSGASPHSAAQATMLDATGPVSTTCLISAQRTRAAASCRCAHVVDIHVDTHTDTSSTVIPEEVRAMLKYIVLKYLCSAIPGVLIIICL